MALSLRNALSQGRGWGRAFLYVFNAYSVVCMMLLGQIAKQDLSKPTYHLNEDGQFLANFSPLCKSLGADSERDCFTFGLATAPAHVEDQLDDSWLDFALATKPGVNPETKLPNKLNVPAFHNVPFPEQRVRFWSDAETEIKLAAETGITTYRLGVDWGRLVPEEPLKNTMAVLDRQALEHYKGILRQVKAHGMKVMLHLFHHLFDAKLGD